MTGMEAYVSTAATAMTVISNIFGTMSEIDKVEDNRSAIILGTMVGAQAALDILKDTLTNEPMPEMEFMTLVSMIRKDFEEFVKRKL